MLALPGGGAEGDELAALWRSGALCDVALRAGDADAPPLPCHRVVLAAASPFFRCGQPRAPRCLGTDADTAP